MDFRLTHSLNNVSGLTFIGIGFIPLSIAEAPSLADKGVGKVIVKNANGAITLAAATLRKLGKGDPIAYIKNIDWQGLAKEGSALITEKITALRDALNSITDTWVLKTTLSDEAIVSLTKHSKQLNEVLPKIEDGIAKAAKVLEAKTNKALKDYQGELAGFGISNLPKKAKTLELDAPKGNELKGAQTKRLDVPSRKTPDDFAEFKSMNHKKAATGEYNAHQLMGEKGYTPLGKTDGNYKPGETGIDGIYNHQNPPPDFVITEAKYNTARLGKTKTGKQMSDDWITDKRLQKAGLDEKQRRKIRRAIKKNDGTVQKLLIRNKEDGTLIVKELDENANIIGKALEL